MPSIIDQLTPIISSAWFALALAIAAIAIGSAISTYFYVKSKKEKVPRYAMVSNNIIRDLPPMQELRVTYRGQIVENFTVTRVMFWNQGRETIRENDIAEQLTIKPKGNYKILDARKTEDNNKPSQFDVSMTDDGLVRCKFLYIDKDQGCIIQVSHTGKESDDIEMTGTIMSARKLFRKDINIRAYRESKKRLMSMGLQILVYVLAGYFIGILTKSLATAIAIWVITSPLALMFGIGFVTRREGIPIGLESFAGPFAQEEAKGKKPDRSTRFLRNLAGFRSGS
jgi:hypothetical protein